MAANAVSVDNTDAWVSDAAIEALELSRYADKPMLTSGMAAEVLGISAAQLRRLGLNPDATYENEYHKTCSLYRRDTVLELYDDVRVVRARWRRTGARDWDGVFRRAYEERRQALLDAAKAMLELNRYAKTSDRDTKVRIYGIKRRFVRHLWESGFCISIHRHTHEVRQKDCWSCHGGGCERCDDTGIYEEAHTLSFLVFRFEIDGQSFVWHQPEELAGWVPPQLIADEPASDWRPGQIHEAAGPSVGFAKAYALIEWAMGEETAASST